MKQIALGFKQYIQDYDEKYPMAYHNYSGSWLSGWKDPLDPYLKSTQIFKCPSGARAKAGHYAYNDDLHLKKESVVDHSALVILNWEKDWVTGYGEGCARYGGDGAVFGPYTAAGHGCDFPATVYNESERHLEGSNFSFVDGHVKWYRPEAIKMEPNASDPTFRVH